MAAILDGQTLTLSGFVGDNWFGDGFTYDDVLVALASIEDDSDLTAVINSGGGYATEGSAIHALLARRAGRTHVLVDGVAASAASLIAAAGETVSMSRGSIMMIHDPAGSTFGNSADHQKTVEALEAMATSYARVYAAKSGKSAEDCRAIMKAETWLTPEQAVEQGFADAVAEDDAAAVAAFDYRIYAHAPSDLRAVALANGWTFTAARAASNRTPPKASAPAPTGQKKETPTMTDKTKADTNAAELETAKATAASDAVKADRERRTAIMALPEAEGRAALAEHLHASTDMSVDEVKATLAAAPVGGEPLLEPTPSPEAYDKKRATASGLAQPGGKGGDGKSGVTSWAEFRAKRGKAA